MSQTVAHVCECNSMSCKLMVKIPLDVGERIKRENLILVVNGCVTPAMDGDILVEEREGYSLYREESR